MNVTVTDKITSTVASYIERTIAASPSLQHIRKEALIQFQKTGLPSNKSEEYKHTPITRALEKNIDFEKTNAVEDKAINLDKILLKGIEANVLVFINGVFSKEHSKIISPSSVVTILPLEEAIVERKDLVLQYFSKYADIKSDPFTALNTAIWSNGLFLHVPANTVVKEPIFIYNIHNVEQDQTITALRNLILVGKSSEVTVLEKFDSAGSFYSFSSVVTEGVVDENACLNFYCIQNDNGNRYQYELAQFQQANSSRVNTYTFTMNGKLVRNNLQLALDGEGIESHMYGLYLLSNDTLADNHTVVDHKKPHSFSNELYKGIMDDTAKGIFNGKIYVRPNAQKTNAFQANRNVLLTDKASINTKPQLEIWADDVKCSHGCTSGQLDEEALFYLKARGISKETAQAMMLYAFAGELLENIKHEGIKNYIDELVSERLHKNF